MAYVVRVVQIAYQYGLGDFPDDDGCGWVVFVRMRVGLVLGKTSESHLFLEIWTLLAVAR